MLTYDNYNRLYINCSAFMGKSSTIYIEYNCKQLLFILLVMNGYFCMK